MSETGVSQESAQEAEARPATLYDWSAHYDDEGTMYYHNSVTDETSWDPPEEGFNPPEEEPPTDADAVPDNQKQSKEQPKGEEASENLLDTEQVSEKEAASIWETHQDDEGNEYYYNTLTDETQWDKPAELSRDNDQKEAKQDKEGTEYQEEEKLSGSEEEKQDEIVKKQTGEIEVDAVPPTPEKSDFKNEGDYSAEKVDSGQKSDEKSLPATWETHEDDEGREYYYNTLTGETKWDKPDELEQSESQAVVKGQGNAGLSEHGEEQAQDSVDAANTQKEKAIVAETVTKESGGSEEEVADAEVPGSVWEVHDDDEGREYYYNTETGQTQWEKPDELEHLEAQTIAKKNQGQGFVGSDEAASAIDIANKSKEVPAFAWVAYEDEEGREYYYNEETGETKWDKPEEGYAKLSQAIGDDASSKIESSVQDAEMQTMESKEQERAAKEESREPEKEEIIDPAVKKAQDAEKALNLPDSIMEPDVMVNVTEVVKSENGKPQKAIQALIESFQGQTAICGLLGHWLADFKSATNVRSSASKVNGGDGSQGLSEATADEIRQVAQDVVNRVAKERFSKESGDSILDLSRSEAKFLEDMMDSPRWRKLLIDLSAAHKDSAVLIFCLREISKRGHHREIARRINQSDHFAVFNAMLQSELTVMGKLAVSAGSETAASVGLEELVTYLRRSCTSNAYTYLYSSEVLRYLIAKAKKQEEETEDNIHSDRFRRAIRKWEMLAQNLVSAMVDPSTSSSVAGTSPLFRKRRLDVALTISELYQRQRKRHKPLDEHEDSYNGEKDPKSVLESALLEFLRRHAIGMQVDNTILDPMLPAGLDLNTAQDVGTLLIEYPLAVQALLGHLFKPGSARLTDPVLKNKCARLVALAVLSAEKAALIESSENSGEVIEAQSDEVALTRLILQGAELCEQVENMISFLVTTSSDKPGTPMSPGQKLCSLALQNAPVAQGVLIWSLEFTGKQEFADIASFPTLSVSILSLVRRVAIEHPFTRQKALQVALAFLRHTNSDVSYQKMNAIKEQSLRLLIFLFAKGEVASVLESISSRLQQQNVSEIDPSLCRYFVAGVLEVVKPPFSLVFVRKFCALLKAPRCIDAVRSTYFGEANRKRLLNLLGGFKKLENDDYAKPSVSDLQLITSTAKLYQVKNMQ